MDLQKYSDNFLDVTFLRFIPKSVTPNQVTWLRILSIPFILYFLLKGSYVMGLTLFVISATTDALDGAMARKRNQITEWGKTWDAMADRGLIAVVAFMFIPKYFGWDLLIAIIFLELANVWSALRSKKIIKMDPGANWAGKVKMIIQSFAFGFLFIGILANASFWFKLSGLLLYISLFFTFLQIFLYPKQIT